MLKKLSISNFAIIENIEASFEDGFTVLTGETGAGKSLIIDSLSLLLGARASSELIRAGEEKAVIKGLFEIDHPRVRALISKLGGIYEGTLEVVRIIGRNKNQVQLNGVNATLGDLNLIAPYLADIHNQFDSEKILNPENYIAIIDGFKGEAASSFRKRYSDGLSLYKEKKSSLEELYRKKAKVEENREFYEYQLNELKGLSLEKGEEESVKNEISLLRNYDKIYSLCSEADSIIREDFLDRLYELNKILSKLSSFQEQYKESAEILDERYYEIDDTFQTLKKQFSRMDYNPNRLETLMNRQSEFEQLKRKYKRSIDELVDYQDELQRLLSEASDFDGSIAEAKEAMEAARHEAFERGKDLSSLRKDIAKTIEKELERNMSDLGMRARFAVAFKELDESDEGRFLESGIDSVDFMIETNVGEGMKCLDKTISGGEASRITLSFKDILVKSSGIGTVIFDEIDTGVSGEMAERMARKIKEISLMSQVIAITHMPQVASKADHALKISKTVKGGRTYTSIKDLTLDERIEEVASLIGVGTVTDKQREYARELIFQ